jgi:hypothetical protein
VAGERSEPLTATQLMYASTDRPPRRHTYVMMWSTPDRHAATNRPRRTREGATVHE